MAAVEEVPSDARASSHSLELSSSESDCQTVSSPSEASCYSTPAVAFTDENESMADGINKTEIQRDLYTEALAKADDLIYTP